MLELSYLSGGRTLRSSGAYLFHLYVWFEYCYVEIIHLITFVETQHNQFYLEDSTPTQLSKLK
jgi:hypothetical protein